MQTYQFESVIPSDGTIQLPTFLSHLANHRIKFILIDLEQPPENPVERLEEIIQKYNNIDEPDIDMTDIYPRST